jgi:hypothetical protein
MEDLNFHVLYGGDRMEVMLSKSEVEKLIKRDIPLINGIKWTSNGEIKLEVDVANLERVRVDDKVIFKFRRPNAALPPFSYAITTSEVAGETRFHLTLQ